MLKKSLSVLFVPIYFFITCSFASGASLSINPSGNGVYIVQGNGMDGVASIELTVTYDIAALASPSVSKGSLISGALMVANTKNPGSIRIAIASTNVLSGSGPIILISFANKGAGNVQVSSNKIFDNNGATVAQQSSSGFISTPGIPFSDPITSTAATVVSSSGSTTAATVSSSTSTALTTSLGTVSNPVDIQPKGDVKPLTEVSAVKPLQQPPAVAEAVAAVTEQHAVEKPAEPVAIAEVQQTVYGSILERFHIYQGEKTPATMVSLFAKTVAPAIRQEPAIAISDGTTIVRIIVDLPTFSGLSPNFALNGARMVSLKSGNMSGRWILETLPTKNSLNATVTILNGNSIIEYPLTIVLSGVSVSAKESSFSNFIKNAGTKVPNRDLNGDGRRDYLDDYIYTALYLIKNGFGQTTKQ